jgi:hypothetical protein
VERLFAFRYRLDALGFLDVDLSPELFRVEHLFDHPAVLIVGAPWLGKTTVARQLERWLRSQPVGLSFGQYLCLTAFGTQGAERELPPVWWESWRRTADSPPACWIIDALDEGQERLGGVSERVLQEIRELDNAHRGQLRLLIFSRQRDWLAEFRSALGGCYSLGPLRGLPEFQLAPLHREAACEVVRQESGDSAAFDQVADAIRRFHLQPIAGYPAALAYLCRRRTDTALSVVSVWRGILEHLFREHSSSRRQALRSEPEARFQAASRMAAALALAGTDQVTDHSLAPGLPTLADLFPMCDDGMSLRPVAREACEVGPFFNTAEGGYRFAQRNIQDWLAAYGLAALRLGPLRSALCNGQGHVFPRHRELLSLLRQVSNDPAVREWIDGRSDGLPLPSDLMGPLLADSLRCIDQLETVATAAPSAMRAYDAGLSRLAAPGLGLELAARLQDAGRDPAAKELLLDIGLATDAFPLLPVTVALVADGSQPIRLRRRALLVVQREGGDGHFRQLAGPVGQSEGQSEDEQRLRAAVIRGLLERRLWTVAEAARYAPPSEPHVIDDRHMLLKMLLERMSAADARTLLRDRHRNVAILRRVIDRHQGLDVRQAAITKLLKTEHLDDADQVLLTDLALEGESDGGRRDVGFEVLERLRTNPAARRRFYESGVTAQQNGQAPLPSWPWALVVDDWEWLFARAQAEWGDLPYVWKDVYRLARQANETGWLDAPTWARICALVDGYVPGFAEQFDQNRQAAERARCEHERAMAESRQEIPYHSLGEVVETILNQPDLSDEHTMRELAWLCLVADGRPSDVTGQWDDLDPSQQARARSALRQGLEQATPTPVPDGNEFAGAILCEARAFLDVLEDADQVEWLTPERVQRWLPAAVFALHDRIPYLVRRCAAVDPASALTILLDAAERELRAGFRYAIRALAIPVEWWANRVVSDRVAGWAQDEAFQAEARAHLLELLALRAPDRAIPIAGAWSELPAASNEAALLRRMGLNCRLALDPAGAWQRIEGLYQSEGETVLRGLEALYDWRGQLHVDLTSWPTDRLESLSRLLLDAYPIASDREREGRIIRVTPTTQLGDARDRVIGLLLRRGAPDAEAALERLAAVDSGLSRWLQAHRARLQAQAIVGALPASVPDRESSVPLAEAVRLLDRADYWLIRSPDDLQEAVCTALEQVGHDVAADLPLLHGKPPRRRNPKSGSSQRTHLEEDALQAYVRRRLTDLLPRIVPEARVEILREDQIRYRRRLDVRVLAPCLHTRGLATVVVEVKWSDNRKVESGLVEQLGQKYLLGEHLTHGIYLVGWCGCWTRRGQGRQTSRADLEAYLADQRDRFCAEGVGTGLRIRPIVLGLEWPGS